MLALQIPLLAPALRWVQRREQCAKIVLMYRERIWITVTPVLQALLTHVRYR
jgi:hypothetical protein